MNGKDRDQIGCLAGRCREVMAMGVAVGFYQLWIIGQEQIGFLAVILLYIQPKIRSRYLILIYKNLEFV